MIEHPKPDIEHERRMRGRDFHLENPPLQGHSILAQAQPEPSVFALEYSIKESLLSELAWVNNLLDKHSITP